MKDGDVTFRMDAYDDDRRRRRDFDATMSTPSSFGLEDLALLDAKLPQKRLLCGIVCRPDTADQIRQVSREVAESEGKSPFVMSLPSFFGVEIYTDDKQEAPWIPFFDRWKLNAYLRRNDKQPTENT